MCRTMRFAASAMDSSTIPNSKQLLKNEVEV